MADMFGSIGSDGKTVTLTTGSIPAWDGTINTLLGAQVFGYNGTASVVAAGATVSAITDSTHFTISAAGHANVSGVKFVMSLYWTAAMNVWWYNYTDHPPTEGTSTSIGAGYLGSDGYQSIDLSPAGLTASAWIFDDGFYATAAGQTQTAAKFVHNSVMLQTGSYDMTASTNTFYIGNSTANPAPIFPSVGPSSNYWPQGGICLNSYVTLITGFVVQAGSPALWGPRCVTWWVKNIKTGSSPTAPSSWNYQLIDSPWIGNWPQCSDSQAWVIDGSYLYVYGSGAGDGANNSTRNIYAVRFPLADVQVTSGTPSLARPQYYLGPTLGWSDSAFYGEDNPSILSRQVPMFRQNNKVIEILDNGGSLYQKSDGSYVFLNAPFYGIYNGYFATSPSISSPSWSGFLQCFTQLAGTTSAYGMCAHPEQTWTGKSTDDMLVTYNVNQTDNVFSTTFRMTGV